MPSRIPGSSISGSATSSQPTGSLPSWHPTPRPSSALSRRPETKAPSSMPRMGAAPGPSSSPTAVMSSSRPCNTRRWRTALRTEMTKGSHRSDRNRTGHDQRLKHGGFLSPPHPSSLSLQGAGKKVGYRRALANVIIAIAGPIGVGKSTVARGLAARLGYRSISGGEVFRDIARARGISVIDVNKLAEQDSTLDRELDERQRELAKGGNCVVESRLAGWMVEADLKIWLRAAVDVRAARVARRGGQALDSARAGLVERGRSEGGRYKPPHNIDTNEPSPSHLIIDTSYWSADAIADTLAGLVRSMQARDQGPGTRDQVKAEHAGGR